MDHHQHGGLDGNSSVVGGVRRRRRQFAGAVAFVGLVGATFPFFLREPNDRTSNIQTSYKRSLSANSGASFDAITDGGEEDMASMANVWHPGWMFGRHHDVRELVEADQLQITTNTAAAGQQPAEEEIHRQRKTTETTSTETTSTKNTPLELPVFNEESDLPPPTLSDISYGPYLENTLDFWKADGGTSMGPRPIIIYIHGGGWRIGNKHSLLTAESIQPFLDMGVSFASINYRLTGDLTYTLPAPVHDAARAVQFIKSKATEWNIDKNRVALSGFSAGGATTMWLLYHNDLADPNSDDPVERESTKVQAAAVLCGQASIDPKIIEPWLGRKVAEHNMILNAVGEKTYEAMMASYDEHAELFREYSPINHVKAAASASNGAPPLFMVYDRWDMTLPCERQGRCIHHAMFGAKMKERCDEAEVECHLFIPGSVKSEVYKTPADFLFYKLGVHKKRLGTGVKS